MQAGTRRLGALLAIAVLTVAASATLQDQQTPKQKHRMNLVERIDRGLSLKGTQKEQVDKIVASHQVKIRAILADKTLSQREKGKEIDAKLQAMVLELTQYLSADQIDDLNDLLKGIFEPWPHAKIALEVSDFFPVDGETRSIFGSSLRSYGIGLGGDEKVGRRSRFEFGIDLFSTDSSPNSLFVISPQEGFEYRVPVNKGFYLFGVASAGPSYMDYSYNRPDGAHSAAKRLGLDGAVELGLQWGPARFGVQYRSFSQPSDLNFNGIEATLSVTVLRF